MDTGPLIDAAAKVASFDAATAGTIKAITNVITQAIVGAWREREVVQMIGKGNRHIRDALDRLAEITRSIEGENRQEAEEVANYYFRLGKNSRDPAGIAASDEWREYHQAEVAARRPGLENYLKVIAEIKKGHQFLFDHPKDLSVKETVRQIKLIEADLRTAAKALKL